MIFDIIQLHCHYIKSRKNTSCGCYEWWCMYTVTLRRVECGYLYAYCDEVESGFLRLNNLRIRLNECMRLCAFIAHVCMCNVNACVQCICTRNVHRGWINKSQEKWGTTIGENKCNKLSVNYSPRFCFFGCSANFKWMNDEKW